MKIVSTIEIAVKTGSEYLYIREVIEYLDKPIDGVPLDDFLHRRVTMIRDRMEDLLLSETRLFLKCNATHYTEHKPFHAGILVKDRMRIEEFLCSLEEKGILPLKLTHNDRQELLMMPLNDWGFHVSFHKRYTH